AQAGAARAPLRRDLLQLRGSTQVQGQVRPAVAAALPGLARRPGAAARAAGHRGPDRGRHARGGIEMNGSSNGGFPHRRKDARNGRFKARAFAVAVPGARACLREALLILSLLLAPTGPALAARHAAAPPQQSEPAAEPVDTAPQQART